MIEKITPATAAAQLKQELPGWTAAEMTDWADNSQTGYWDFCLELNGSMLSCQYCANSGYWLEIQDEYGKPIIDAKADYYPSLTEAIAALRQAAAKQMQVLGTLGDVHGK